MNLQDLRTVLGRLDAERPAALDNRSGRTRYEARGGDFLDRLDLELTSRRGKARVLVTGQIGVGKSSELWHYVADRRTGQRGFWIFCDLEKQAHPDDCGATGVLLTVLRDCWAATKNIWAGRDQLLPIRDEILSRLIDWLKGQYAEDREAVVFRFGGMDFTITLRADRKDEALALVLGKAAQHEAVSKPPERFGVAPDSLVFLLNQLLDWIARRGRGEPPILVVDHVDKIRDPAAAEDVLVRAVPQWSRIHASIVMTAPYEYTLGELRHSVESRWGGLLTLYPLEFAPRGADGLPAIYAKLARGAGLEPLIVPESLELFAHFSGGVLRTFVQFLIEGCKEAHLARHGRIEPTDAWSVIHKAERAYQDYGVRQLELLDEIARTETGLGLGEAQTLLRSPIGLLVAEPHHGRQQLRIHPLAQAALASYQLQKKARA